MAEYKLKNRPGDVGPRNLYSGGSIEKNAQYLEIMIPGKTPPENKYLAVASAGKYFDLVNTSGNVVDSGKTVGLIAMDVDDIRKGSLTKDEMGVTSLESEIRIKNTLVLSLGKNLEKINSDHRKLLEDKAALESSNPADVDAIASISEQIAGNERMARSAKIVLEDRKKGLLELNVKLSELKAKVDGLPTKGPGKDLTVIDYLVGTGNITGFLKSSYVTKEYRNDSDVTPEDFSAFVDELILVLTGKAVANPEFKRTAAALSGTTPKFKGKIEPVANAVYSQDIPEALFNVVDARKEIYGGNYSGSYSGGDRSYLSLDFVDVTDFSRPLTVGIKNGSNGEIAGIKLHMYPDSFQVSHSKSVNRSMSFTRWVEEHWGDELSSISFSGSSMGFYTREEGTSHIYREKSAAYIEMQQLVSFVMTNGIVYQDDAVLKKEAEIENANEPYRSIGLGAHSDQKTADDVVKENISTRENWINEGYASLYLDTSVVDRLNDRLYKTNMFTRPARFLIPNLDQYGNIGGAAKSDGTDLENTAFFVYTRDKHPRAGMIRKRYPVRLKNDYAEFYGFFENFDVNENASSPFKFTYSATFKVEKVKYL